MKNLIRFQSLFSDAGKRPASTLALFALLNLGMIESLANGMLGVSDALRLFYNAENCVFVRRHFRGKIADRIMSHGVQLPDLFEILSTEEAHREFHHELAAMRSLCLKLLEKKRRVA